MPTKPLPFTLAPNPAATTCTVALPSPATDNLQVQLLNLFGQPITTTSLPKGQTQLNLLLQQLPNGVYLLLITHPNQQKGMQKIVIQH